MDNSNVAPEVTQVLSRVQGLRIPLSNYVDKITFVYKRPAAVGFDFECSDSQNLIAMLSLNLNFAHDNKSDSAGYLATKLSTGISFREVNPRNSVHFEISKLSANVHIDSVSVVIGRDEHGDAIYDTSNLLQHLVSDHLNKDRIIAPNREDGFVFGFRW